MKDQIEILEKFLNYQIHDPKIQNIFSSLDKIIALREQQIQNYHKLKLSLWMEHQCRNHVGHMWCDKITGTERQGLFNDFLVLYKNGHGEPFDGYERRTRSYHLENFKAHMMWYYRKNKERVNRK